MNKIPAETSVSELKVMVMLYKNASSLPIPTTKAALIEQLHATIGRDDPIEPKIPTLDYMPQLPAVADHMLHNNLGEEVQQSTDLRNEDDSSSANCSYKSRNILQKLLATLRMFGMPIEGP